MATSWTPILIPTEHYIDIATLIQQHLDALGFIADTDGAVEIRVEPFVSDTVHGGEDAKGVQRALDAHVAWSVDNLRALFRNPTATAQRWVKAIDVCANHVGEFLPTETIAVESGMEVNMWRSACRKITAHQRVTYPGEESWPLATASGRDIGKPFGPLYVALSDEQAERWAAAKSHEAA